MGIYANSLKLITQPTVEPVTVAEAAAALRMNIPSPQTPLERLIKAARNYVEGRTGQRIVRQKWRMYFDAFADEMVLSPPQVREVVQVQYVDGDGVTQTLSTSYYTVDIAGQRLRRAYGQTWPTPRYEANCVWVDVWAGMYDETASPANVTNRIPEDIKQAVILQVAILNGSLLPQEQEAAERARDMLMDPYWMPTI